MLKCVDMGDFESSIENLVVAKAENIVHNFHKKEFQDNEGFLRDDLKRFCKQYNQDEDYGLLLQNVLLETALRYISTQK